MPNEIELKLNGRAVTVPAGCTAAAAVLRHEGTAFRLSVMGEARGPLCGMGICFECRLTIDGVAQRRSCQVLCRPGMEIETDATGPRV
jgi:sarcosine oxidase subunit alpha